MLARHTSRTGHSGIIWVARAIGLSAALMWTFILVAHLSEEGLGAFEIEGFTLSVLVLIAVVAVGTAFYAEEAGGWVALAAGIALAVFAAVTAGRNQWMAILFSGTPFILSGALFVVGARGRGGYRAWHES